MVPKSWGPLAHTLHHDEGIKLIEAYPEWRCDAERMALGKEHMLYMHPLPADRGREVTDEVIDGPQSVNVRIAHDVAALQSFQVNDGLRTHGCGVTVARNVRLDH